MTPPVLAVSHPVIRELIRLGVTEVPGVLRVGSAGPRWRRFAAWRPVSVRIRNGVVYARVTVVARPGQSLPALAHEVRTAVATSIERLLGLRVGDVTVRIDGVGG
jgi:uncharacterized alkaline shock family protein YloU